MDLHYSTISSHSQWQTLKEVWLGGVYPDSFFSHLSNKTQDIFGHINELTRKDFAHLKQTLESLNVRVVEPEYTKVDDYLDKQERLQKPPVSPCDFALTLADTLYITPQYQSGVDPYQHAIDAYRQNKQKVVIIDRDKDPMAWVEFPGIVKAGRDIIIDYDATVMERVQNNKKIASKLSRDYRVHLSTTGDHQDGIFFPFKPGHIISSNYQNKYTQSFPNWDIYFLKKEVKQWHGNIGAKWWLSNVDYAVYNDQVLEVSEKWLGNPIETVFDVNNLAVDENTIIVSSLSDNTAKYLENLGVDAHVSDFKTKYYWDAGIHCCTSDIHRLGECIDYWPDRGPEGIYRINEWT